MHKLADILRRAKNVERLQLRAQEQDGLLLAHERLLPTGVTRVIAIGGLTSTLMLGAAGAAGAALFLPPQDYPTGGYPHSVAIGDLNDDGRPDLAVANNEGSVSVLLGNGDGSFRPKQDLPFAYSPTAVAIGDLNRDGRLDLAVAVSASPSGVISVLLGNGDGTFQAQRDYPTGIDPTSVAIADLNGDHEPDLATMNAGSNSVSILFGRGDGTFLPKQDLPTSSTAYSLAIGDLNGDGAPDLAVASTLSDAVSIYLGNGDGTFQAHQDYPTATGPDSVAVADLNGDGKLDLAVTNVASNTVSTLLGNGDGSFHAKRDYPTNTCPDSVAVADLNGDGKRDLAVANDCQAGNVSVLLGNGDGSFQAKQDFTTGYSPSAIAAGDFNRDGNPDLAVANFGSDSVSVLVAAGTPDVTPPSISCAAPDDLWHNGNVLLPCTAADSETGLANSADAAFSLSTSVTGGTETSNATTGSRTVCDNAGNCATAGPIAGNMIDLKPPAIAIASPANGSALVLNSPAVATYSCADGGSGVRSCSGSLANGASLDTASVGAKTFTLAASDNVGNLATASSSYTIIYMSGGTCDGAPGHQILQPINADGSSVFKQGSTVTAKFRVCDANGTSVGTAGVVNNFRLVQTIAGTTSTSVNEAVDTSNPDSAFRWDPSAQEWVFNISTKTLSAGTTYVYQITLNDGSTIGFRFGLR